MKIPSASLAVLFLAAGAGAQPLDETLVVERREDITARDRLGAVLRARTLPLRGTFTIQELCTLLGRACGDRVGFVFMAKARKAADVEALDLDLPAATPLQALRLLRELRGVQAVLRAGLVCLVPAEEVTEATWLELIDVRAELMPLRDFPGPALTLPAPGQERAVEREPEPHTTVAGFDGGQLENLVREHAARGTWDRPDVSVSVHHGVLIVRQTERGHREVRRLLVALGIGPRAAR